MSMPTCTIIAGPNGAGKTTFAMNYLVEVAQCKKFINADLIASGLSPLSPETELLAASKIFLREIEEAIQKKENFAFETTLSGRTNLKRIEALQADGWHVELYYLYLPALQISIERVAERVRHGGHDIPLDSLKRRYPRSLYNLLHLYAPICDTTVCLDNSDEIPTIIFTQRNNEDRKIENSLIYGKMVSGAER